MAHRAQPGETVTLVVDTRDRLGKLVDPVGVTWTAKDRLNNQVASGSGTHISTGIHHIYYTIPGTATHGHTYKVEAIVDLGSSRTKKASYRVDVRNG